MSATHDPGSCPVCVKVKARAKADEAMKERRRGKLEFLLEASKAARNMIDVSTIRPGKKNEKQWGDLKDLLDAAIKNAEN